MARDDDDRSDGSDRFGKVFPLMPKAMRAALIAGAGGNLGRAMARGWPKRCRNWVAAPGRKDRCGSPRALPDSPWPGAGETQPGQTLVNNAALWSQGRFADLTRVEGSVAE